MTETRNECKELNDSNGSVGRDCPNPYCGNSGGYPEPYLDGHGVEQVDHAQCEWCWTTPDSKFNLSQNAKD